MSTTSIDEIRGVMGYRAAIIKDADRLIKHGKKVQKTKGSGQMSLFDSENFESNLAIVPESLSDAEVGRMVLRETDAIGLSLLYDEYGKYFLHEKVLCTMPLENMSNWSEDKFNMYSLAKLKSHELRYTKTGKKYCLATFAKGPHEVKFWLFGEDFENYYHRLFENRIYIIKSLYAANRNTFKLCGLFDPEKIDMRDYVSEIAICFNERFKAPIIRDYVMKEMYVSKALKPEEHKMCFTFWFMYHRSQFKPAYKVKIDYEDYKALAKLGAKIKFKKRI